MCLLMGPTDERAEALCPAKEKPNGHPDKILGVSTSCPNHAVVVDLIGQLDRATRCPGIWSDVILCL